MEVMIEQALNMMNCKEKKLMVVVWRLEPIIAKVFPYKLTQRYKILKC